MYRGPSTAQLAKCASCFAQDDGSEWSALEDLRDAAGFEIVGDVGAAGAFAAGAWCGEEFFGVGDVVGVEGVADALHGLEVGGGVHVGHAALLLAADAVFAGDGAA